MSNKRILVTVVGLFQRLYGNIDQAEPIIERFENMGYDVIWIVLP